MSIGFSAPGIVSANKRPKMLAYSHCQEHDISLLKTTKNLIREL